MSVQLSWWLNFVFIANWCTGGQNCMRLVVQGGQAYAFINNHFIFLSLLFPVNT